MMTFAWIIVGLFGLLVAAYAYADYEATVGARAPYLPAHRRPEPRDIAAFEVVSAKVVAEGAAAEESAQPDWDDEDFARHWQLMRDDINAIFEPVADDDMQDKRPANTQVAGSPAAAPDAEPGEYTREEPHACDGGSCGHGFAVTSPGRALALVGQAP